MRTMTTTHSNENDIFDRSSDRADRELSEGRVSVCTQRARSVAKLGRVCYKSPRCALSRARPRVDWATPLPREGGGSTEWCITLRTRTSTREARPERCHISLFADYRNGRLQRWRVVRVGARVAVYVCGAQHHQLHADLVHFCPVSASVARHRQYDCECHAHTAKSVTLTRLNLC